MRLRKRQQGQQVACQADTSVLGHRYSYRLRSYRLRSNGAHDDAWQAASQVAPAAAPRVRDARRSSCPTGARTGHNKTTSSGPRPLERRGFRRQCHGPRACGSRRAQGRRGRHGFISVRRDPVPQILFTIQYRSAGELRLLRRRARGVRVRRVRGPDRGVPSCRGAFTSSIRLVAISLP